MSELSPFSLPALVMAQVQTNPGRFLSALLKESSNQAVAVCAAPRSPARIARDKSGPSWVSGGTVSMGGEEEQGQHPAASPGGDSRHGEVYLSPKRLLVLC